MKLVFTPQAAAELEEILDYIAIRSPKGASRVHSRINRLVELLLVYPNAGRLAKKARIRRLATTPYPFQIFYRATGEQVTIVGIRHTSRKPRQNLD